MTNRLEAFERYNLRQNLASLDPKPEKLQWAVLSLCLCGPAGVRWRGHDRPVPGGEGGSSAPSPGGETQAPNVSARYPQPPRAAGGDVRLKQQQQQQWPACTKQLWRGGSQESKDASLLINCFLFKCVCVRACVFEKRMRGQRKDPSTRLYVDQINVNM